MLKRTSVLTDDGSSSIYLPEWGETYHSKHGAIQEASHIYINNGAKFLKNQSEISVLEIGFGTGLNALLTAIYAEENHRKVKYYTIEKYPLEQDEIQRLNYTSEIKFEYSAQYFEAIHQSSWGQMEKIHSFFSIQKICQDLKNIETIELPIIDIIYFDAFSYDYQPELWSRTIFEQLAKISHSSTVLVTYAAKGIIKRNLQEAGWTLERLAGPPGKRHMIRAYKTNT